MRDQYRNKYRITIARLQKWDFRNNAAYFVTICTHNRKHFFGEIEIGPSGPEMKLYKIGKLAEQYWLEIRIHFEFIQLGNFIEIPNHLHGILIMDNLLGTLQCNVCTESKNIHMSEISPKPGSISTIIRSYKSVVSKNVRFINPNFAWQSRFHDPIIRDTESYERIHNYISNNPKNWKEDELNK